MAALGLTSSGSIIAKLYRDLRLSDPQYEMDAIEWIGEAISIIGRGASISTKEAVIEVEDFYGQLPTGMFMLKNTFLMKGAESADDVDAPLVQLDWGSGSNWPGYTRSEEERCGVDTILIKGAHIHATFEEGFVKIVYDAISVDENGWPMVPNHGSFQNAFIWYITRQLIMGGWTHPDRGIDFNRADSMWERYCRQARSLAAYPSVPQVDQFIGRWLSIMPLLSEPVTRSSSKKYGVIDYGIHDPTYP